MINREFNKKIFLIAFLILFWKFFIFWVLTVPEIPSEIPAPIWGDKIIHFVLFAVLSFLVFSFFYLLNYSNIEALLISFSWSSIYSFFCEHVQSFLPYREASFYDFLASILGAATVFIIIKMKDGLNNNKKDSKPRVLLHICCAGCGAYVSELLHNNYEVVLYYYNPNMYPAEEYDKRLDEVLKVAKKYKIELIIGAYDYGMWLTKVKGMENEPERGIRCGVCFNDRLEKTALEAKKRNFDFFSTTLSVSPHKNFDTINKIGIDLENKYKVKFLGEDFKKDNGYQRSIKLSKELDLYRQNYCGCEFSRRHKNTK